MCLLALCKTSTIPKENFEKAFKTNDDGFGFAFRKNDKVVYFKGFMTVEDAWKNYSQFAREKIFPHVIHFRMGKPTEAMLTHPFEVSDVSPLYLNNVTDNDVLFHNGVISGWRDRMFESFVLSRKIPEGPIIDTRVAAIWYHHFGKDIFRFIDGKFIVFGKDKLEIYGEFKEDEGILYSNDSYKPYKYTYTTRTYNTGYQGGFDYMDYSDIIDEFIV